MKERRHRLSPSLPSPTPATSATSPLPRRWRQTATSLMLVLNREALPQRLRRLPREAARHPIEKLAQGGGHTGTRRHRSFELEVGSYSGEAHELPRIKVKHQWEQIAALVDSAASISVVNSSLLPPSHHVKQCPTSCPMAGEGRAKNIRRHCSQNQDRSDRQRHISNYLFRKSRVAGSTGKLS